MEIEPKTQPPGSTPSVFTSTNHTNLTDLTVSELVSKLRTTFCFDEFDSVENVLVARDAKLKAEIASLQAKIEVERLEYKLQAEEELKKKEELCQKGKIAQECYENLLKEVKENGLLHMNSTVHELKIKNCELLTENCKLKELKKNWLDESIAIAELRIRVRELEGEREDDKSALDALRKRNNELEEALKKNSAENEMRITAFDASRTENAKLLDMETHHSLDAGTARSSSKLNKDAPVVPSRTKNASAHQQGGGQKDVHKEENAVVVAPQRFRTSSFRKRRELEPAGPSEPAPSSSDSTDSSSSDEEVEEHEQEEAENQMVVVIDDPQDLSLLTTYPEHQAKEIWLGNDRLLNRCHNHAFDMPRLYDKKKVPQQVREIVERSGLAPLVDSAYGCVDKRLLGAFVDRWYEDTNTFHLPFGEMTVTLDDVSSILHIPVSGTLIPWDKPQGPEAIELMHHFLGVERPDALQETLDTRSGSVKFITLKDWYAKAVKKRRYEIAARCYLLYLVGTTLFTDKSNNSVAVHYLNAFADLDKVDQYAWGASGLAYLYDHLSFTCKAKKASMAGYMTLLQAWILDHFPMIGSCARLHEDYEEHMPRVFKWEPQPSVAKSETHFRMYLEKIMPEQIIWQPYDPDHREYRAFEEVSLYSGHLRIGNIRMRYLPERVLRQFGYIQGIPRDPPIGLPVPSEIDESFGQWHLEVLSDEMRGRHVAYPGECTLGYLDWVHRVSHPFLLPTTTRVDRPEATLLARALCRLHRIDQYVEQMMQTQILNMDALSGIRDLTLTPITEEVPEGTKRRRGGSAAGRGDGNGGGNKAPRGSGNSGARSRRRCQ